MTEPSNCAECRFWRGLSLALFIFITTALVMIAWMGQFSIRRERVACKALLADEGLVALSSVRAPVEVVCVDYLPEASK